MFARRAARRAAARPVSCSDQSAAPASAVGTAAATPVPISNVAAGRSGGTASSRPADTQRAHRHLGEHRVQRVAEPGAVQEVLHRLRPQRGVDGAADGLDRLVERWRRRPPGRGSPSGSCAPLPAATRTAVNARASSGDRDAEAIDTTVSDRQLRGAKRNLSRCTPARSPPERTVRDLPVPCVAAARRDARTAVGGARLLDRAVSSGCTGRRLRPVRPLRRSSAARPPWSTRCSSSRSHDARRTCPRTSRRPCSRRCSPTSCTAGSPSAPTTGCRWLTAQWEARRRRPPRAAGHQRRPRLAARHGQRRRARRADRPASSRVTAADRAIRFVALRWIFVPAARPTPATASAGRPGPPRHVLFLVPPANYEPPSSSGPGRRPFKAVARVRTPLGARTTARARSTQQGPVAQLVSAPPCHGGGRGFESRQGRHPVLVTGRGR